MLNTHSFFLILVLQVGKQEWWWVLVSDGPALVLRPYKLLNLKTHESVSASKRLSFTWFHRFFFFLQIKFPFQLPSKKGKYTWKIAVVSDSYFGPSAEIDLNV